MRLFVVDNYPDHLNKFVVLDILPDPPEVIKVFDSLEEAQKFTEDFYGSTSV